MMKSTFFFDCAPSADLTSFCIFIFVGQIVVWQIAGSCACALHIEHCLNKRLNIRKEINDFSFSSRRHMISTDMIEKFNDSVKKLTVWMIGKRCMFQKLLRDSNTLENKEKPMQSSFESYHCIEISHHAIHFINIKIMKYSIESLTFDIRPASSNPCLENNNMADRSLTSATMFLNIKKLNFIIIHLSFFLSFK